jgi:hypothetical protein
MNIGGRSNRNFPEISFATTATNRRNRQFRKTTRRFQQQRILSQFKE